MGQIERTLAKLRQQALVSSAPKHSQQPKGSQVTTHHGDADLVYRSDILDNARSVLLDQRVLEANRVIGVRGADAAGSAYRMLRTRVLQRMRSNGWRKLAVTSPRANAGKTLTAINMAISLAQEPNQQVVLVDLDLRSPKIATYLGLDVQASLTDHLLRDVPIENVLVKPDIPRLCVAPNSEPIENSSDVLASAGMHQLTRSLLSTSPSTIVIFDLPPLLDADDMLTFMPQVDAVLFVVAEGETRKGDIERSNELFKELTVLGTVLNKSSDEAPSYY